MSGVRIGRVDTERAVSVDPEHAVGFQIEITAPRSHVQRDAHRALVDVKPDRRPLIVEHAGVHRETDYARHPSRALSRDCRNCAKARRLHRSTRHGCSDDAMSAVQTVKRLVSKISLDAGGLGRSRFATIARSAAAIAMSAARFISNLRPAFFEIEGARQHRADGRHHRVALEVGADHDDVRARIRKEPGGRCRTA